MRDGMLNATAGNAAPERQSIYLAIATLVSGLGGFLFGYDNLVISGAIGYVSRFYALDAAGIGWVASCAVIGCLIGSATAGWIVGQAFPPKYGCHDWACRTNRHD